MTDKIALCADWKENPGDVMDEVNRCLKEKGVEARFFRVDDGESDAYTFGLLLKDEPEYNEAELYFEDDVADIALAFRKVIQKHHDVDELAEMDSKNATPIYKELNACASHNFCDANVYMAEAFAEVLGYDADSSSTDLLNAAWAKAKADGFSKEIE